MGGGRAPPSPKGGISPVRPTARHPIGGGPRGGGGNLVLWAGLTLKDMLQSCDVHMSCLALKAATCDSFDHVRFNHVRVWENLSLPPQLGVPHYGDPKALTWQTPPFECRPPHGHKSPMGTSYGPNEWETLGGRRQTKGGVLPQNCGRCLWRIGQDRWGPGGAARAAAAGEGTRSGKPPPSPTYPAQSYRRLLFMGGAQLSLSADKPIPSFWRVNSLMCLK